TPASSALDQPQRRQPPRLISSAPIATVLQLRKSSAMKAPTVPAQARMVSASAAQCGWKRPQTEHPAKPLKKKQSSDTRLIHPKTPRSASIHKGPIPTVRPARLKKCALAPPPVFL